MIDQLIGNKPSFERDRLAVNLRRTPKSYNNRTSRIAYKCSPRLTTSTSSYVVFRTADGFHGRGRFAVLKYCIRYVTARTFYRQQCGQVEQLVRCVLCDQKPLENEMIFHLCSLHGGST